ncbi:MAG: response regulator [Hyphomonadaceae bacterium]
MASLDDLRVLIVDDNVHMRVLVRCLLKAGGVTRVTEADSGEAGLRMLKSVQADLVIVDWKMAPVDGAAFTAAVRRGEAPNPFIPILMLTAHTEASRVAGARDAGVSGFIRKPISAQLLFDRVASALTDTRMFVRSAAFIGPDRRHGQAHNYAGPFRRETDRGAGEDLDLDDLRWTA